MPQNAQITGKRIFSTMNTMWDMLGDHSVGSQWYTKRIITGNIFIATELHMVHTESKGYQSTWDFLQTQLQGQNFENVPDLFTLWYKYANSAVKFVYPKYE